MVVSKSHEQSWLTHLLPEATKREWLDILKSHGFRISVNDLGFQPVPPPEFDLSSVFYDHGSNSILVTPKYGSAVEFFDPNKLDGYLSLRKVMGT